MRFSCSSASDIQIYRHIYIYRYTYDTPSTGPRSLFYERFVFVIQSWESSQEASWYYSLWKSKSITMRGPLILGLDNGKPSYLPVLSCFDLILGKPFSKISMDFPLDLGAKEVTAHGIDLILMQMMTKSMNLIATHSLYRDFCRHFSFFLLRGCCSC